MKMMMIPMMMMVMVMVMIVMMMMKRSGEPLYIWVAESRFKHEGGCDNG